MSTTPADLWKYALPPSSLFQHPDLEPGAWTDPEQDAGTGLGTVTLADESNPRQEWDFTVQVVTGGEVNVAGIRNPGGVPTVRISTDGGTTWTRALTPDDQGRIALTKYGLTLVLENGTAGAVVNFGSGNSQLRVTPKRAGLTVTIEDPGAASQELSHEWDGDDDLVISLGTDAMSAITTTAAALAEYLTDTGQMLDAMSFSYGGTGAGVVAAAAETALPFASFVVLDSWTFSTDPSPDVLAALAAADDEADGYLRNSLSLPLATEGARLKQVRCELARWALVCKIGAQKEWAIYEPKAARKWLEMVADGTIVPADNTSEAEARTFAEIVTGMDVLTTEDGGLPI